MAPKLCKKPAKLVNICHCQSQNKSKPCFRIFRSVAVAICFLLFIILTMDIYVNYSDQLTNVGVRTRTQGLMAKNMPCITVCPWEAFHKQGLYYNNEMVRRASFGKEEIFCENEKYPIFNETLYSITELRSFMFGRCYMVCPILPFKIDEDFRILLKQGINLKVFVHSKEDGIWIPTSITSIKMTVLNVDIVYGEEIYSFEGVVTEKHFKSLSKDNNPCSEYPDGQKGFITCSKAFLVAYLRSKINCTIPGLTEFLADAALPECSDPASANHTIDESFEKLLFTNHKEWFKLCPLPCTQVVFDVEMQRFHKNNMPYTYYDKYGAAAVMFLLKYENFVIEEHIETLVYSTANFLAQAGGNLGLLLGFSCMSILLTSINFIEKLFKC